MLTSKLCIFQRQISWKLSNIWQTPLLPANSQSSSAFDWHIYIWPWPVLKVKVNVMNIWKWISWKWCRHRERYYGQQIRSHAWVFVGHIYIRHDPFYRFGSGTKGSHDWLAFDWHICIWCWQIRMIKDKVMLFWTGMMSISLFSHTERSDVHIVFVKELSPMNVADTT